MADPRLENEAVAVTGRPNDIPIDPPEEAPLGGNSTFADRARGNASKVASKQVVSAEDKAVKADESKAAPRAKKR
jgi:hypothetical protein